jgi:D-alanyl-D-alanine carboxypeptidase
MGGETNLALNESVLGPHESVPAVGPDELALGPVVGGPARIDDAAPPLVTARHVAIIDEGSGALLYGQNAHTRVPPASTTKIATTLVALERAADLGQLVRVTVSGSRMEAADGSSVMGLEPGRQVTLETLLYGMMLPSGNDAAEQVALALAGSRERYVDWMNETVAELGLHDTRFANPSGMDDPGHYSSAYDMAMLARRAMRHPAFRQMAGAAHYYGDDYALTNLNRLIGWYAGADGVKVGFTDEARKTIVASATRNGHRVYVGLMRSEDLPSDSMSLFDWVWQTYAW